MSGSLVIQRFQRLAASPLAGPGTMQTGTMQPVPLRLPAFQGKTTIAKPKPTIVVCSDFDETFIHWEARNKKGLPLGLSQTLAYLKRHQAQTKLLFNTGRSLFSFRDTLESHPDSPLQKLVLDALIVCNGQEILYNPKKLPLKQWLSTISPSLSPSLRDADWAKSQQALTGWRTETANSLLENTLKQAGFTCTETIKGSDNRYQSYRLERPGKEPILMDRFLDQPAYRVKGLDASPTPDQLQWGEKIAADLLKTMEAQGWRVELKRAIFHFKPPSPRTPYSEMAFFFTPLGVNKGRALQHYLNRQEKIDGVIPAGDDDYNDVELLLHPYQTPDGKPMPVFPIAVGDNLNLLRQVAQKLEAAFVPKGGLAEGLKSQFKKIRTLFRRQKTG